MRPKRVTQPNAVYHVISRIAHQAFLMDEEERGRFVDLLRRAAVFSGVEILTYAVLSNHFHLLVRVPERQKVDDEELLHRLRILYGEARFANTMDRWAYWRKHGLGVLVRQAKARLRARMYDLTQFAKTLKEAYSVDYNRRKGHHGTIWESRFKSLLVESGYEALVTVASYIEANPIKAGLVRKVGEYRWSGLGATLQGSASAKDGVLLLVRLAMSETGARPLSEHAMSETGARPLSEQDAIDWYKKEVERIRPGCVSGKTDDSARRRTQETLSTGNPVGRDGIGYCHVAYFERGGIIGSQRFVMEVLQQTGRRCKAVLARCLDGYGLHTGHGLRGRIVEFIG